MPASNRTNTPNAPGTGLSDRCDGWLLASDRRLAAELLALLAREVPTMQLRQVEQPPAPDSASAGFGHAPRVCFLHVPPGARQELNWLAALSAPPLAVPTVAILEAEDPETALRCLRSGACGCLIRPFDAEQLMPLLLRVGFHGAAGEAGGRGKVLCVLPAKGASGASTLAAGLACQAGRAGFKRVLLADLDPLAGTLAFSLKLKSPYSFVDALSHAERLDADLWKGLVCSYRGLDVLLAPEEPAGNDAGPGVEQLVAFARRAYDLVVLDTGGPFTRLGAALAQLGDEILMVVTSELGAVYAARRTLSHLAAGGVLRSSIKLVIGRWRKDLGFDRQEIEAALGLSIFHVLPNDPQAVEAALLEGRPAAAGSNFGKSLSELAARVLGADPPAGRDSAPAPRRGLLSLGI